MYMTFCHDGIKQIIFFGNSPIPPSNIANHHDAKGDETCHQLNYLFKN